MPRTLTPEQKEDRRKYLKEYRRKNGAKLRAQERARYHATIGESRRKAREKRNRRAEECNRRCREWRVKNPKAAKKMVRAVVVRKLTTLGRLKMLYGCEICRARPHPCALDFHHRDPQTKKFSLSTGCGTRGWKSIREEVKKCAILCANCHRRVENGDLQCS